MISYEYFELELHEALMDYLEANVMFTLVQYTLMANLFYTMIQECSVQHIHIIYCLSGGITGAGARITGTVGDVFARLTLDEEFIDK